MTFGKECLSLTDTSIGDFSFDDVAYFSISKELTDDFFAETHLIPRDNCGIDNRDYVSGEIQIFFNRKSQCFEEALIAPVYEEDGGLSTGDIVSISELVSDDVISMTKGILFKGVSNG